MWQVLPSVGDKTPKFRFRGELYSKSTFHLGSPATADKPMVDALFYFVTFLAHYIYVGFMYNKWMN